MSVHPKREKRRIRLSLRQKLTVYFSIAFCVIIAGFGILILKSNGERYKNQSVDYCRKIVEANIALIDNYFEQLNNVVQIVASDADIITAVNYRENTKTVDYSVELFNQRRVAMKIDQFDVLDDVQNAVIIGSNGKYLYYSDQSLKKEYSFLEQPWFLQAMPVKNPSFLNYHPTDYLLNDKGAQTVSLLAPIQNTHKYFVEAPAYLLCDFSLEPIRMSTAKRGETYTAVYAGSQPVYFPEEIGLDAQQRSQLDEKIAVGNTCFIVDRTRQTKHSYLVVTERSKISGWLILGILPMDSLQELSRTNTMFVVVLILVCFVVTLILSSQIARSVLVPMNQLIDKFNAIARGEKNIRFEKTQSVEVDRIAQTAEKMLQKNNELTQTLIEESHQRAQATLRALQHQINPHFLNNVLQSMKALAVCNDTESVSKMTTLLGKLLTYSVYNPYDMVTLQSEFDYTSIYIALQNIRFENKILYTQDLSPEAADFKMPKLILQPLVENAIVHGLNTSEGGEITVSADRDEESVYIAVTNSGSTIAPERLEALNTLLREGSADERESSIGLLNVRARLKGCFGPQADLQIMARGGMNTSIVLTIPTQEEERSC